MRSQVELVRAGDWDVLIVLDTCRADVFRETCAPQAETVQSPARRTDRWLHTEIGKLLRQRRAVYFTGNPVVARETQHWPHFERVDVWEWAWGRHGPLNLPYVHPLTLAGVVAAWAAMGRLKGRAAVVHHLAPHSPYIGDPGYALTWFREGIPGCEMTLESNKVVEYAGWAKEIDFELLRRAYRANLALAWEAARLTADRLARDGRRVVITADHGELLGESADGAPDGPAVFGHQVAYTNPLLCEVPWLPWDAEDGVPETTTEKLEALGYV